MASKQVIDDGKRADMLAEAARTYAPEVARRRAALYKAAGLREAPSAAEVEAGLRADAAVLAARREELRARDAELAAELGDDAEVLARRDRCAADVRATLVDFRQSVQTNCGDAAVAEMGFSGETPRDPAAVEELGRKVAGNVAKKPPRSVKRGVRFDAKAAVEGLDGQVEALAKANADVRREKREEQLARARRDEAWGAFERELGSLAARLDAALRAVGLDDVADRLTPTSRSAAVTDGPPAPAPQPA